MGGIGSSETSDSARIWETERHTELNGPRNTIVHPRSKLAVRFKLSAATLRQNRELPAEAELRHVDVPETCSDEMILAVETALGEKLKWTDPPDRKDSGNDSYYSSGSDSEWHKTETGRVEEPWCFVLVQPGMVERWKVMAPRQPTRLWLLNPRDPELWYRVPVNRVQSAIRWMQPLIAGSLSHMVGFYFRRAARLMSCYLVGDPSKPKTWEEILCAPELQSPNSLEHVFGHLLTLPSFLDFRILEFGAVEDPHTGAVTIRVATHITSVNKWVRGPEMTTAGRRIDAPRPSRAPAARNVGQFISSCVKGGFVYIAIVTPPAGQQQGLVQVWSYSWEEKEFKEIIEAMGWRNDPKVGKAVWETFQLLYDYDSRKLMIWAGWTLDESYTGEVDRNAEWEVSIFGRLRPDKIAEKWVLDRRKESSKISRADFYFSQPCYASGSGRDVQISPTRNGDFLSSRVSNLGDLGFDSLNDALNLSYPPDWYLDTMDMEDAGKSVCIGSFWPKAESINKILRLNEQEKRDSPVVQMPKRICTDPLPYRDDMEL